MCTCNKLMCSNSICVNVGALCWPYILSICAEQSITYMHVHVPLKCALLYTLRTSCGSVCACTVNLTTASEVDLCFST